MTKEEMFLRHRRLGEEGWRFRFTAEEPRLSEMKEFYESMGLEVVVEPGYPEEDQVCRSCFDAAGFEDRYKAIYTRGTEVCAGKDSAGPAA